MFLQIWNPEKYHPSNGKKPFFEGWYFKLLDKNEENAMAIIPGISFSKNNSHSFIQVLDGKLLNANYHIFNQKEFSSSKNNFEINIGKNFFSRQKIIMDINDNFQKIKGELEFKDFSFWPKTFFSPGAMGWYSFIPFMECYHGVLSLYHTITGKLSINDRFIDFTNGIGYIEKDWGKSFPTSWIWMQTNHFNKKNSCIMISIAKIPFLGNKFTGFIAGLLINGKFYNFSTYTNAKLENLSISGRNVFIEISDNKFKLVVETIQNKGKELTFPISKGGMSGKVEESLSGTISVKLYELNTGKIIFSDIGRNAGVEIQGNIEELC